jgi:hypothetical protein
MSVTQTVFLVRAKLPTREAWAIALKEHGFALEIDPAFDPAGSEGYVPCSHAGEDAGFEYAVAAADAYLEEQKLPQLRTKLNGRDTAVSFVTHSRLADLKAAMIAAGVLGTIADGLLWSDEAGELIEEPLALARVIVAETDAPVAPPAEPRSIKVELATRVVFRGNALTTLQTLEATPRRFTVKVGIGDAAEVHILALWEHPVGAATVHLLRAGDKTFELDPKGASSASKSIATSIMKLGDSEDATRELIAAGAGAVLPLCDVVSDERRPMIVRRAAILILAQIHDAGSVPTLRAFAEHAELGAAARDALAKLS